MTETPPSTDDFSMYTSHNIEQQYDFGPAGLRAVLESRARRAYYAIFEAEKARQRIAGLSLEPPLTQLQDSIQNCDQTIQEAIWHLTGQKEREITTQTHGARLAAQRLPHNPDEATEIRACANELYRSGTNILAQMSYARDCGDFSGAKDIYDDLWQAAVTLTGNAAAIADAVSDGFEEDAAEYRHRKNGDLE